MCQRATLIGGYMGGYRSFCSCECSHALLNVITLMEAVQ